MDRPETFTRAELIDATGLSAPTVGSLVSDLIRIGVVKDLGAGPSRGGRRPSFMEFNARHGCVGGHRPRADADAPGGGRPARRAARPSRDAHAHGPGPGPLSCVSPRALRSLMREAQIPFDRLLAVGAGAPGAVDRDGMEVALAPRT